MIKLHQFPPTYGLPNGSPFCMKVENYLRMTRIAYEVVNDFDLAKAPKGKLPYIEDAERVIADSGLILDYLKAAYGDPLDAHLTPVEKAVSLAFIRLMDEHLYWAAAIQPRYVEPAGWEITRSVFFRGLTRPLRYVVPRVARYKLKQELWGHGVGRHRREEIYAMGSADVTALGAYLGEKPFFHGGSAYDPRRRRLCLYRKCHLGPDRITGEATCLGPAEPGGLLSADEGSIWRSAMIRGHIANPCVRCTLIYLRYLSWFYCNQLWRYSCEI